MKRDVLKARAASLLHGTGIYKLIGSFNGTRRLPVIVGYHRVVENFNANLQTSIPSLLISRKMLERHLDWLARRYRLVDLDELGARIESGEDSRPIAAVTFDDGYADLYEHALPMLQRKGIPAAVFVITNLAGSADVPAHDLLYLLLARRIGRRNMPAWSGITIPNIDQMTAYQATRVLIETLPAAAIQQVIETLQRDDEIPERFLREFRILNWEQIKRVRAAGFTIGSHTRSHIILPNETASRVQTELAGSRADLENALGGTVRHFVYPSGSFNSASVHQVADAGYRYAYTGCTHRSPEYPLLTMPRAVLWENSSLDAHRAFSGSVLNCQIYHAFDLAGGCRKSHHAVGS